MKEDSELATRREAGITRAEGSEMNVDQLKRTLKQSLQIIELQEAQLATRDPQVVDTRVSRRDDGGLDYGGLGPDQYYRHIKPVNLNNENDAQSLNEERIVYIDIGNRFDTMLQAWEKEAAGRYKFWIKALKHVSELPQLMKEMSDAGYIPATLKDGYWFGREHPDVLRQRDRHKEGKSLVLAGSVWISPQRFACPVLTCHDYVPQGFKVRIMIAALFSAAPHPHLGYFSPIPTFTVHDSIGQHPRLLFRSVAPI